MTLAPADIGVTDPDSASFTFTASAITGGFFQLSSAPELRSLRSPALSSPVA